MAEKYKIMISYTMFFGVYIAISLMVGYQTLTGQPQMLNAPRCDKGFTVIDKAVLCAFENFPSLYALFNLSTPIGLLNVILIMPYFAFLVLMILDYIRGI